jgi:micrococcal nuclease
MGRAVRCFLTAVLTAVVASCAPAGRADDVPVTAVVLKAVDGDTVDVRDDVRGRLRVRLSGIDTPETKKPGYSVGCGGPEATRFAQDTLVGQRVAIITDPRQDARDRYGPWPTWVAQTDGITRSSQPA